MAWPREKPTEKKAGSSQLLKEGNLVYHQPRIGGGRISHLIRRGRELFSEKGKECAFARLNPTKNKNNSAVL